jgi:hypothetical protein
VTAAPAVGTTALTAIHGAGVVHRDFLKPMCCSGRTAPRRRLRHARLTDGHDHEQAHRHPSYVAPEQLVPAPDQRRRHIRLGGGDDLPPPATWRSRRQRARKYVPDLAKNRT